MRSFELLIQEEYEDTVTAGLRHLVYHYRFGTVTDITSERTIQLSAKIIF
jgi:hypothetical protein